MLRSQQGPAPAHLSLSRVHQQAHIPAQIDFNAHHLDHSVFWPSSVTTDAENIPSKTPTSSFDFDSTPKTFSQLLLDDIQGHSRAELLQTGLSSVESAPGTGSEPPSALSGSSSDSNTLATTGSGCESSPAMSSGSSYNFSTPSVHQVSTLTQPFSTSSPAVGSAGTVEAGSGQASPSHHEQSWNHSSHNRKSGMESPDGYSHKTATAGSHQAHYAHPGYFNDPEYSAQTSGVPQYLQHRASISGPLMDSAAYAERTANTPAPPRVHGLAAWENSSGSARPHTADGMFGQFGVVGPHLATQESSAESSVVGNPAGSSSRPYTPGGHAAGIDPFYQHRRMSMPDPTATGTGKVFSYMASGGDEATFSSSGMGMPSHSYGGHYFGRAYGGSASKKRPRRRYDEIERLYPCSWPGCTKSYGTLNHLNAHVAMQKHGPKRSPSEFKDMRKAWRKQKKEEEQRRQARQASMSEQTLRPSFSGAGYGEAPAGHVETAGPSALPIGPPPAMGAFGGQHAAPLPGLAQLPVSMANLGRYSMSSASAAPGVAQGFYLNGTSADAASQAHHEHSHNVTPLQHTGDNRLAYPNTSSANTHYNNLGAYLSAHRGSV